MNPVTYNLRATALLELNRPRDAAKVLRRGMEGLLDVWKTHQDSDKADKILCRSSLRVKTVPISIQGTLYDHRLTSPDQTFALFNRTFVVEASDLRNLNEFEQREILAVFLYNIALSHHIMALQAAAATATADATSAKGVDLENKYYEAALSFYDMAVYTLCQEQHEGTVCLLLFLALFNNIGHIFSNSHNHIGTRNCCDLIRDVLKTVPEWDKENEGSLTDERNNDFAFFRSFFQLARKRTVVSAAA